MANPYIWGSLDRAVNDPTKIDEAIGIAIDAHNNNPDAHLEDGQSLTTHRAADIIDHRAESVVNDKIRANARTYIAIVDPSGNGDYTNIEDACDYASEKGGGSVYIKAGSYTPTRTLNLRYSVDLYGEGPTETHIDMVNAGFKGINVAGNVVVNVQSVPKMFFYEGSDQAEVVAPDGMTAEDMDLMYGVFPWFDGLVYAQFGPSFLGLPDYCPADEEIDDFQLVPTVTASVSSKIVQVNGWKLCSGLDDGEGKILVTNAGELGIVKTYLGNGQFELEENSHVDAMNSVDIAFTGEAGRMSVLQGFSMNCRSSDYFLATDGQKGRLYIRDASFTNVGGFFKSDAYLNTMEGLGVTIEDTDFRFRNSNCDGNIAGATLRNCNLYFQDSSSKPVNLGGYRSYFENCRFIGNISGTNKLDSVQRYARFQSCEFSAFSAGTLCNSGTYSSAAIDARVLFNSCIFSNGLATNMLFNGSNILVQGCTFLVSSGSVGLATAARYSVFAANQGKGTLAAQPTNCIVTANGFWSSMS